MFSCQLLLGIGGNFLFRWYSSSNKSNAHCGMEIDSISRSWFLFVFFLWIKYCIIHSQRTSYHLYRHMLNDLFGNCCSPDKTQSKKRRRINQSKPFYSLAIKLSKHSSFSLSLSQLYALNLFYCMAVLRKRYCLTILALVRMSNVMYLLITWWFKLSLSLLLLSKASSVKSNMALCVI